MFRYEFWDMLQLFGASEFIAQTMIRNSQVCNRLLALRAPVYWSISKGCRPSRQALLRNILWLDKYYFWLWWRSLSLGWRRWLCRTSLASSWCWHLAPLLYSLYIQAMLSAQMFNCYWFRPKLLACIHLKWSLKGCIGRMWPGSCLRCLSLRRCATYYLTFLTADIGGLPYLNWRTIVRCISRKQRLKIERSWRMGWLGGRRH